MVESNKAAGAEETSDTAYLIKKEKFEKRCKKRLDKKEIRC